ncbi:MAG: nucleotidyltransferase domain-containing protein [Chloroflexia bacterium]
MQLAIELEDLLDVPQVDLIVLPEADPFLALEVIRGELLYCTDPDAQAEYELYVLRRASDLAPYAHARYRAILEGEGR